MNLATKALLILLLLAVSAVGGAWLYARFVPTPAVPEVAPEVVTKTVTRVVTRNLPSPAGECPAPTETTITETVTKTLPGTATTIRRGWSLGLGWDARRTFERDYLPTSVEVGRRAFSDLWLTTGWNWREGSILMGVRYEF